MSRHHASALIALGIVICAGFFVSMPALANPGHGIAALKSGKLLQLSPGEILIAGRDSEPYGAPALLAGDDEPVISTSQNSSGSADSQPLPADSAPPDDQRLMGLTNTAGIRLMRLSMEHAHAICLQDEDAAAVAADNLYALSTRLTGEVQPLLVSPEQQPIKDEFIRLLAVYSAVSQELLGTPESVPAAFRELSAASEGLEAISQQTGASMMRPAAITTLATHAVLPGDTPIPETLPLRERHTYDDPSGENMVSLLVESTRTVAAYQAAPINTSAMKVEAGEGRMFLLVVVKSTNLGHRGDSDLYTIETPGLSMFTLEYQGTAFTPIEVPPFTSLGESFGQKTLERYESLKGYLYFDVPDSLNTSEAALRADLGYAGIPTWDLGRESGAA